MRKPERYPYENAIEDEPMQKSSMTALSNLKIKIKELVIVSLAVTFTLLTLIMFVIPGQVKYAMRLCCFYLASLRGRSIRSAVAACMCSLKDRYEANNWLKPQFNIGAREECNPHEPNK